MIHQKVVDTLEGVLRTFKKATGPADAFLKHYFLNQPSLGSHERALIAELFYAGLRRYRHLEGWVPDGHPRHQALMILTRIRGVSLRDLESAITDDDRQWMATARQEARALPSSLGLDAELPDWVVSHLEKDMSPADILQLGRVLQESAPLDLRVNSFKAKRPEVLAMLQKAEVDAAATPYSPWGIRVVGKPALQSLAVFKEGFIEVQDEGSQLLGLLVSAKRGDMVVDFCAGAGGKTLLLGAAMQNEGRLYAFDVSEKRLSQLKPRLKRSGLSNVHPVLIESERDPRVKRLKGKIDRVLVDAPCSGLGTLRRNPDLKLRQTPKGLEELLEKQAKILDAAAELLKPGGLLVYATCSLLAAENEGQAEAFSARHPEFETMPCGRLLAEARIDLPMGDKLRLWPHVHGTDGFFAAAWIRKGGEQV